MNLQQYVDKNRPQLVKHIQNFFREKRLLLDSSLCFDQDTLIKLEPFTLNGKLLRGVLLLLAYEMHGGKLNNNVFNAAAAIELTHSGFLIHDDIMDRDRLRRGLPTIYEQYRLMGEKLKTKDSLNFGQSLAICAGDLMFFMAMELLTKTITNNLQLKKIQETFNSIVYGVLSGQMLDVYYGSAGLEPTHQTVMDIYRYKTAFYSFSLPFKIGASLSNQTDKNIKVLEKLGEYLGLIFQIKDDEMGIYGDEKIIGKPIGSDIRENKKTLLRALLYEKSSQVEKEKLNQLFGKPTVSKEDVNFIIMQLDNKNIRQKINNILKTLVQKTERLIKKLSCEEKYKQLLRELIEYNLKRNK